MQGANLLGRLQIVVHQVVRNGDARLDHDHAIRAGDKAEIGWIVVVTLFHAARNVEQQRLDVLATDEGLQCLQRGDIVAGGVDLGVGAIHHVELEDQRGVGGARDHQMICLGGGGQTQRLVVGQDDVRASQIRIGRQIDVFGQRDGLGGG